MSGSIAIRRFRPDCLQASMTACRILSSLRAPGETTLRAVCSGISRPTPNSVAFSTSQRKRSTLGTAVASTISRIRRGRIAAANAEPERGRGFRQAHNLGLRLGPRSVENGQVIAGPAAAERAAK